MTLLLQALAGELVNVLREARQVVPDALLKFGTHVKKKVYISILFDTFFFFFIRFAVYPLAWHICLEMFCKHAWSSVFCSELVYTVLHCIAGVQAVWSSLQRNFG